MEGGFHDNAVGLYPQSYWDKARESLLTNSEIERLSKTADEVYNKEMFGEYWEHMKIFKYRDESQKHKHCRILSGVKFAKDMLKIKPDDEYYKRMLAQREQELFEFEVKIACNR